MASLDPFLTSNAFNMSSLTGSINDMPNMYGRIRELGVFNRVVRATTRSVMIDEQNGVLNLLPTMPPGSPGSLAKPPTRKVHSLTVPQIPHDDELLPEQYMGIRAFGSESEMAGVVQVVNDKLEVMRAKHAITLEHLRMGAIKGTILDADGSTIYNLHTVFGPTLKVVDFLLGTATTNIIAKTHEVLRHIEDNLRGEMMTNVHALVSSEFWDKFIVHANVVKAYQNWSAAGEVLGGDMRKGFRFGGILWEEYRGTATDGAGNARRFIAATEGHAFPVGTADTFVQIWAPADFLETANTPGQELYAKQEPKKFGRGIDIHTQSNPLPICKRPAVLVKVHTSN